MKEILCFDPERHTNRQATADAETLGYLGGAEDLILDLTYGLGRFWPPELLPRVTRNDLDPTRAADLRCDYTCTPFGDNSWPVVVFDPPYKLNGTSQGLRDDIAYGVAPSSRAKDKLENIIEGAIEAARITAKRGWLLIKCQDQTLSGRKISQTHIVMWAIERHHPNMYLHDMLHVLGTTRPQPAGRTQKTSRSTYSTLLIFRKLAR